MRQRAAAVGGMQRAAGQEAILACGGVTTRNDALSPSHIHGESSFFSWDPSFWVLSLGTVTPCLPLDLVPAFPSVSTLGPCTKPCLTSIPQFASLSVSFPQTPFLPLCFFPAFFPHPLLLFLLGSCCVEVDLLFSAWPGQCWDEALQVQGEQWESWCPSGKKDVLPNSNLQEDILLGIQEVG